MDDMNKKRDDVMKGLGGLAASSPDQLKAFQGFMHTCESDGALSKKTKELISVGIAIKAQCSYCIAYHVKGAIDAGATRAEILETVWVAAVMGGGPALMYGLEAVKALDDFGAK